MTKYTIGEQMFAVIEGELWVKVKAVDSPAPVIAEESKEGKNVREHRNISKPKQVNVPGKKRRRGAIDPQLKEALLEEYKTGSSTINGLARKYKIGYGTVWQICKAVAARPKGNSGEPLKLSVTPQRYVCSDGHRFESKLPLSHARCPSCKQFADVLDVDQPVIEEREEVPL